VTLKVSGDVRILVTGSSGFVGSRVVQMALERGWECVEVSRRPFDRKNTAKRRCFPISDISSSTDWTNAFDQIDCVVHCAARVHQMHETEAEALTAYHNVNTLGSLQLARQAAQAGVKRFVFLSSIKVNGEVTDEGRPFKPDLDNRPNDPYGRSKFDAEMGLQQISKETGLDIVIIRPPLVYGPGVKANFRSMMNWINRGVPLPFGAIDNKRSLVFLDNLADLILLSCSHKKAQGETFLVSDDNDCSLSQLLGVIAHAMKKKDRLLPIPSVWIQGVATLFGKSDIASRLCGNLQVDISTTKSRLGWTPPVSFATGIQRTVTYYLQEKHPSEESR